MLLEQVALVYFILFKACFLLAVVFLLASLPVYLLWFVFIPALSRIE